MDNKKPNNPGNPNAGNSKPACKCGGKDCKCKTSGGGCKDNCGTPHKK